MQRLRRPSALLVAALVLVASFAALSLTHRTVEPRLGRAAAVRAVFDRPASARALAHGTHWTSVRVTPVDSTTTRVTFFRGGRLLAMAAVNAHGRVTRFGDYRGAAQPYGAAIAQRPWLIALGCLLFALATAVVPLLRLRNLDVLALLSFVVPLALLDGRWSDASALTAVPPLLYLTARCAWLGLATPRTAPAPARPLLDALTPTWDDAARVRVLRLVVGAAAVAVTMITVTALQPVDVAQAVMEGATLLLHGTLPYGHLPGDVFHGDTYPLLSYV
ncbi:MAG TPA: hypothetical protein VFV85_02500, partial [Conexibacter sp.]|nr:hypothetical protein [Conexibacter sp.]